MWTLNGNERTFCLQDSGETMPDVEGSDSDLDEEAALRFYRDMEKQLKLKRKGHNAEE